MAAKFPSLDQMRARMAEAIAIKAKIEAKSAPIREELAKHEGDRGKIKARLKKAEEGLFEISREISDLNRALGGRHMSAEGGNFGVETTKRK